MLVPKITSTDALEAPVVRAVEMLPTMLYADAQQAMAVVDNTDAELWANTTAAEAKELLNRGVAVAVIDATQPTDDIGVNAERLAMRYTIAEVAANGVDQVLRSAQDDGIRRAGAVVIEMTAVQIDVAVTNGGLQRLADAAAACLVRNGGSARVLVEQHGGVWTLEQLSAVAASGADAVVPAEELIVEEEPSEDLRLPLATAIITGSGLHSDRADGLLTTVVVDEQGVCLGVAYSNAASLAAALAAAQGVYWSRRRGLWHKGLTSGATQKLLGIAVDCDSDVLRFRVHQDGAGFCHRGTRTCFGTATGISMLAQTLAARREQALAGSYTQRLFDDAELLRAKLIEEAGELADATDPADVAFEAADVLYFALVKCAAHGVSLADIERSLDRKHRRVVRRRGDAKPGAIANLPKAAVNPPTASSTTPFPRTSVLCSDIRAALPGEQICMRVYADDTLSAPERAALMQRPIIDSQEIMQRVQPIVDAVRVGGDSAMRDFTARFDGVTLDAQVVRAPFEVPTLPVDVRAAIDQAYANIHKFHAAQLVADTHVETMPGVTCSRFSRAIERIGLYVPGGTAVLPSTALMLGVPAQVAGCREIVLATPPRPDGSIVPEVLYVAHKVGAAAVVKAGGAQAIAALAYGTETVPKVDKICGPGNQYVTAAKMLAQNDTAAMISIDMPAGPSELLVIADASSNPAYVASDLLSQAEHGPDSQVVLLAVDLSDTQLAAIHTEVHRQAERLPRVDVVRRSIPKSFCLRLPSLTAALDFSNAYAPEHLILHNADARACLPDVVNAGSVFVGPYSPESCGDYASGTNHTLPTYGFSRMYSGVSTTTFLKHITAQELTRDGLANIAQTVMTLAEVEELEAHRNAVAIRMQDM
ncbi:trifunctional histidinol dehydrogenase [Coemansia sp. RSA 988]|nr:trifunctional histidinol dehydrogenase [Coemansia sp. RSA 988]